MDCSMLGGGQKEAIENLVGNERIGYLAYYVRVTQLSPSREPASQK